MGDLGLAGSFGAAGASEGLDEVLARRIAAKHYADVLQQQAFENAMKIRTADNAEALRRDQLSETTRQHNLQDEEKRIGLANTLGDQLPANTALAPSDPAVGMLRAGGRGSLLKHQDANLPSTQNSEVLGLGNKAPLPTGGFLRTKSAGNPEQYIKQASAKQADTEADNTRQTDALARQREVDAERERHDRAMENKPTGQPDARLDRSYQYHRSALDKIAKPLEDQQQRMGRLIESVNQQTPQADALVAPELLTVMAGGAGSGLRMNEAEISRIIGGRSKWQTLKATLDQWNTDPSKATSITPEQRAQIRQLVQAVHEKSQAALATLNQAGDSLIDTDVMGHRRVLADTRKKLQHIFDAAGSDAPAATSGAPQAPAGWKYVPKPGGGWTAVQDKQP